MSSDILLKLIDSFKIEYDLGKDIIRNDVLGTPVPASKRDEYNQSMKKTNTLLGTLLENCDIDSLEELIEHIEDSKYIFKGSSFLKYMLANLMVTIEFEKSLYRAREFNLVGVSGHIISNEVDINFYDFVIWFCREYNLDDEEKENLINFLTKISFGSFALRNMVAGNHEMAEILSSPELFLDVKVDIDDFATLFYQNEINNHFSCLNLINLTGRDEEMRSSYQLMICNVKDIADRKGLSLKDEVIISKDTKFDIEKISEILTRYRKVKRKEK